jgi:hypothetical protein
MIQALLTIPDSSFLPQQFQSGAFVPKIMRMVFYSFCKTVLQPQGPERQHLRRNIRVH